MPLRLDTRIPVAFGHRADATPNDAVLALAPAGASPPHAPGCACCAPRQAAGRALTALLHDRARNRVAFFTRILVVAATPAVRAEVEAALATDPVASACFRLAG